MDEFREFKGAPSWALLLWGLGALWLAGWDVMQGAAVRNSCAAMRVARGERP